MQSGKRWLVVCLVLLLVVPNAHAFLEDLCLPRNANQGALSWCIDPNCSRPNPNRACPGQLVDFGTIKPGRSMIHADSTYFIAQALGYRADVAYWIVAYNEVTDYASYIPIDQCGVQATASNSGANYIAAPFNGFQRTNLNTDGPLDHYVVALSPNGKGTDVHGAMGVQALYPLYYPRPGYPVRIDDTYQTILANLRQWAMRSSSDPGLLCAAGLTDDSGTNCLSNGTLTGKVPILQNPVPKVAPLKITAATGPKVLNYTAGARKNDPPTIVYYDQLQSYLNTKSTGTLWLDGTPGPVPAQLARVGLYIHVLQDTSSHATYCGDDAPSPPGGGDIGTYMTKSGNNATVYFGDSCGFSPHIAGHVQETGTGNNALPLRDYVALNNTVNELIVFGNEVALKNGWIVNPELLPPDVVGGKNAQGKSASDLQAELVGTITSGQPYTNAEQYTSAIVTTPLQQTNTLNRLHAMNAALGNYSNTVAARSADPSKFVPFVPMPGNSFNADDTSVCWK